MSELGEALAELDRELKAHRDIADNRQSRAAYTVALWQVWGQAERRGVMAEVIEKGSP